MDQKTSLLVNRQVPEYVRDEYPLFISFLEAYYEFLENVQGTQKNDLLKKAKDLRYVSDVGYSIDTFEEQFFNMYASLFPKDVQVNKEILIKNALPFYLSKGSEKAFKFLFRMLFNDEVEIIQPKNNILRASDGKWIIDNILKIETDVRSLYTGNGSNTTFRLAQQVNNDEIIVSVNDVVKIVNTDYTIRKESKKLIFSSAPASNSTIKVVYNNFDVALLNNRKVTGLTSGATGLVEKAFKKTITDRLNLGLPFELFINKKTLTGSFLNGELISTDVIDTDGEIVTIEADTFSILTDIIVIDGGAGYNIGDPVLVLGGGAVQPATAEILSVSTGVANKFRIDYGGAGFSLAGNVTSTVPNVSITGAIDGVDTSGTNTNNYYIVTEDMINAYSDIVLSSSDYGFPSSVIPSGENISTRISDALSYTILTGIGPITNAVLLFSNSTTNTAATDSEGAKFVSSNVIYDIKGFRSVGRIDVISGGTGYKVGDEIIFNTNPYHTYGYGAAAAVTEVGASGEVKKIMIQAQRINGTANVLNNTIDIVGTETNFGTDVVVGDRIVIKSQERYINAITSTTSATVNVNFNFNDGTTWANNYPIGSFSRGPIGGINYVQGNFPTVNVSNRSGGSGASIAITSLMGDGEIVTAIADTILGEILSIRVLTGGVGYKYIPQIDLTNYGDGSAVGNAQILLSYSALPGRWVTSDSILSSSERRLQGSDYYIDFSYVTSSFTEFTKYKNILKELLHPAGFINYSEFNKSGLINLDPLEVSVETSNSVPGTVSILNGSIYITGVNTLFNVANTTGTLTIGTSISVNDEIRIVNNVISNSNISVSVAFTTDATNKPIVIIT